MADCWECIHMNTQRCEGCKDGYTDGDSWVYFDEPTHFEPKTERTVEVLVQIPKDLYEGIECRNGELETEYVCDELMKAVDHGTVLPKGHGRLIDVDEVEAILHNKAFDMVESNAKFYTIRWVQKIVRNAPTVIEADKAESEG